MAKSRVEIEEEAKKMVDALEVVFTLSRGLMPAFGFTDEDADLVFERAARLFFEAHRSST